LLDLVLSWVAICCVLETLGCPRRLHHSSRQGSQQGPRPGVGCFAGGRLYPLYRLALPVLAVALGRLLPPARTSAAVRLPLFSLL
jgi:hypothetical protein